MVNNKSKQQGTSSKVKQESKTTRHNGKQQGAMINRSSNKAQWRATL
jgi:hypothetical protein